MWSPLDLQRIATTTYDWSLAVQHTLAAHPHRLLLNDGMVDNQLLPASEKTAVATLQTLLAYPITYIGRRHRQPITPFAAFTRPDPAQCHLAYLLDAATSHEEASAVRWRTHCLLGFFFDLFWFNPSLVHIHAPFPLPPASFDGFVIRQVENQWIAQRI